MLFSFLVALREGVEIALIVAILLGYLRSIGQKRHFREIWMGVGVATVLSVGIGLGLELGSTKISGEVLEGFEGGTMIFAVVILTGMALWMKRQAAGISAELKAQVDTALSKGSLIALVLLAATAVGREGLETAIFLFAGSTAAGNGISFLSGGILGFAIAGAIGVGLYEGSSRLPMRSFFTISGSVVISLAAGLLANSVVALYAAGIIDNIGPRPWDTDAFIPMTSDLGKFLHALLGYDSAPSALQIGLYWTYFVIALGVFGFMPARKRPKPAASAAQQPSTHQTST